MIVVDTSVWIANFRKQAIPQVPLLRDLAAREPIVVGDIVLLEVLQGARDELHANRIERLMRGFDVQPMLNPQIAVQAARNVRALRDHGITIRKTVDVIIGTFCIEGCHTLLHNDRDFDAMERILGLAVAR